MLTPNGPTLYVAKLPLGVTGANTGARKFNWYGSARIDSLHSHSYKFRMRKRNNYSFPIRVLTLGTGMMLISLLFAVMFGWNRLQAKFLMKPQDWAQAPAKIIVSHGYIKPGKYGRSYHFQIAYEFRVSGKTYQSNRVNFYPYTGSTDKSLATAYLSKYPLGTPVTVFYKKGDPAFCTLERDTSSAGYKVFFAALGTGIIIAFVIAFLETSSKRFRRDTKLSAN